MGIVTKDLGIVLRRLDYSETSQVLVVFCREGGLQRLIAKGIKRGTKSRVATGIDLLETGRVTFSRRPGSEAQLGTLTEWLQESRCDAARCGLVAWYAAQYAADRTSQMTEEADPHPDLFDALQQLLDELSTAPPLLALVHYLLHLLRETGLSPQLTQCAGCGGPITRRPIHFSARRGGLLCRDCEPAYVEKRQVDPAALPLLTGAAGPAGDAANVASAFDLLDYHLTESLGQPSRVGKALRDALSRPRR